jgi:hypothetical protein
MAYTLQKTMELMTVNLGHYNKANNKWRLGGSQFTRYVHSPIGDFYLIRDLFEHTTEYPGNKRTPNVAVTFRNVPGKMENQVLAGSVFRMISDLADNGQI